MCIIVTWWENIKNKYAMKQVMFPLLRQHKKKILAGAYVILCFLLYGRILDIGFLSDDWHAMYIAHTHEHIWQFFFTNIVGTNVGSSYGPMWNMLMAGEYTLFQLQAFWYHAVSILFLACIGYIVSLITYECIKKWLVAVAAGVIFITFGAHGETVSWISSQPHLLATLAYVCAVLFYIYFLKQRQKKWYVLSMFAFTLSLFTKEIGITAPAVFFLLELWQAYKQKKKWKEWFVKLVKRLFIPVCIVIAYLLLRRHATGIGAGYYGDAGLSLLDFLRQLPMIVEMTVQLFVPYPWRQTIVNWVLASYAWLWGSALLIFGISCIKNKLKWIVLGVLGMYLVSLVPYLPLSLDPIGNGGERYILLPAVWMSIFFAMSMYVIGTALKTVSQKRLWFTYGAVVLVLITIGTVTLQTKLTHWEQAGNVVQTGIAQLQGEGFSEDDYIYLVGAPTNIRGAQMFLNGTFLVLEFNNTNVSGERLLMMSTLSPDNPRKDFLHVEEDEETVTWEITDHQYSFMGLPMIDTEIGTFTLQNFDKKTHTGPKILLEKNKDNIAALKQEKENIYIVYYTKGRFQKIKL